MENKYKALGATVIAASVMLLSPTLCAETIAPKFTVQSASAIEFEPEQNYVLEQPVPAAIPFRPTMNVADYAAAKRAAAAAYSPSATKPRPLAPVPAVAPTTILQNFNGASDVDGLRPPDTHGAAGLSHFVEVTNSHINIFTKSTQALAKSVSLATFFNYSTQGLFDPRVVYDPVWNRWIVTVDAHAESSTLQRLFIAVSKTSNPTGAFFFYNINVAFNSEDFFDFPQVGFDQDAVIITGTSLARPHSGAVTPSRSPRHCFITVVPSLFRFSAD